MSEDIPVVELLRMRSPADRCAYLPGQDSSYDCRVITQISASDYEEMLANGWRRQGIMFFRPACVDCRQCVGLRVDIPRFRASRSQRRSLRRNAKVRLEIGSPQLTARHLRLFNDYHAAMHELRGWDEKEEDFDLYERTFLAGRFPFELEFRYWLENELVGVALVDATPQAVSSIYFYHAPHWRPLGPGTFSILKEIQYATETGRIFNYLGYWISECGSMDYKQRFAPHQRLYDLMEDTSPMKWTPFDEPT